jgi:hypothetical protein
MEYNDKIIVINKKELSKYASYYAISLDGTKITNSEFFIKEIMLKFPLDPTLSGKVNYDALTDSMWGGLDLLKKNKVVLKWDSYNSIVQNNIQDFIRLMICLNRVSLEVATREFNIDVPVDFRILLVED